MPVRPAKQLKLPYALRDGRFVHVSEVASGRQADCCCPECRRPLIARKGKSVRHHFAHDPKSTCNPETVLHYVAKQMICNGINKAIGEGRSVAATFKCHYCDEDHASDITMGAAGARLEQSLGPVRPDVLLVDAGGEPLVAVEVVVMHAPEPESMQFYVSKRLGLLIVELRTESQLEALHDLKELPATTGTVCPRQRCPDCGHPLMPSPVCVVTDACYNCRRPMQIAFASGRAGARGPEDFTADEVARARRLGCILEERFSHAMGRSYLANVCGKCQEFCGSFYLHDYWYLADTPERNAKQVYCPDCGKHFD